jgi:UDP-GlcNAc3NAcA epimerase
MSTVLCCPTGTAVANLAAEGIMEGVVQVGDCMLDTARFFAERRDPAAVLDRHGVTEGRYFLATLHRAANSDDPARLGSVIAAFGRLDSPVIWPIHPRTRANVAQFGLGAALEAAKNIRAIEPLPYMDTIALLSRASGLLTDSGGMQKEAYFFSVPCVTLREETEWVETVVLGWNTLSGTNEEAIVSAAEAAVSGARPAAHPDVYGDGHAALRIVEALEQGLEGS